MHLAQLNVGFLRHPPDDPRVAEFMDNLDRVNRLAERMPGFVWRLKDDSGNATAISTEDAFGRPGLIVNMSVWESVETLERFVWQTIHERFYRKKGEWFVPMARPHFVMWRVPEGHRPDLFEAADRLARLEANGNTDAAFGWDHLPDVDLWKTARCA